MDFCEYQGCFRKTSILADPLLLANYRTGVESTVLTGFQLAKSRKNLSLNKDTPESRPIEPPEAGK